MLRMGRSIARIGSRYAPVRPLSTIRPSCRVSRLQHVQVVKQRWLPLCSLIYQHSHSLHNSSSLRGKIVPFNLIDVGEAVETVQVKEWLVKVGDTISFGDPVCEVLSDKSSVTVCVPYDGVVHQLMYEIDDVATRGKPLLMIEIEGDKTADTATSILDQGTQTSLDEASSLQPQASTSPTPSSGGSGKVLATPAVRRLAGKENVKLEDVKGSGKDGRILKEDVLSHSEMMKTPEPPVVTPPTSTTITPPHPGDRVVPVKGIRAVMVRTMTASGQIPQFGYCDEIDVSKLVELRSNLKAKLQERGIAFSYLPVILKAISMALHHYPTLNATVDKDCTALTYRADHNIGIAIDTPDGLVVPNIKEVQNKSVFEIASEITHLQQLGLKGQLTPSSIMGGTFSLSNIGAIGGTYVRPLLLPPEVAIGAIGKIQVLPRCDSDGNVITAHVMQVSWSADHRVIDGATVACFSNLWKTYLEEPSMIVELK